MNGILITGGKRPQYKLIQNYMNADYICVADSGLDWAYENGIKFDRLVGDMDSIINKSYLDSVSNTIITELPEDKDDTDTLFGLKHLKSKGCNHISLIGGGEGRLDHLLGIFSLYYSDIKPDIWLTGREIVFYVKGFLNLSRYKGSVISVYPLYKDNCSIDSYGLKWELNEVKWKYRSIGISNLIVGEHPWVDSGDNEFLIILPIEGRTFE